MARPLIDNSFSITDANGNPIPGGQVYTYHKGTTEPKPTYTDSTAETRNSNPVILNASGKASIYGFGYFTVNVLDSTGAQVEGWPQIISPVGDIDNVYTVSNDSSISDHSATSGADYEAGNMAAIIDLIDASVATMSLPGGVYDLGGHTVSVPENITIAAEPNAKIMNGSLIFNKPPAEHIPVSLFGDGAEALSAAALSGAVNILVNMSLDLDGSTVDLRGAHLHWERDNVISNGTIDMAGAHLHTGYFHTFDANLSFIGTPVTPARLINFGVIGQPEKNETINVSDEMSALFNAGFRDCYIDGGHYTIDAYTIRPGNTKRGISIPSNRNIYMQADTVIDMITVEEDAYNMWLIFNVENINVYGGTLYGDMETHSYDPVPTLYNGIGCRIQNAKNIRFYGTTFTRMFTDGYAVVYSTAIPSNECEDIHFYHCSATYNYRNGASIIGCIRGSIIGGDYSHNAGTNPQGGIQVEPNEVKPDGTPAVIEGFIIDRVTADYNGIRGITWAAVGSIQNCVSVNSIMRNNGEQGLSAYQAKNCTFSNNVAVGNPRNYKWQLLENCATDGNVGDEERNHSARYQGIQGLYLPPSGVVGGIKIAHNSAYDIGLSDFTLMWDGFLPNWMPTSSEGIFRKFGGAAGNQSGVIVNVHTLGYIDVYLYRNDAGTLFRSAQRVPTKERVPCQITLSVIREDTGLDGTINIYTNGNLLESIVIPATAKISLANTETTYICGKGTTQTESTFYKAALYNRALNYAEVVDLFEYGIKADDKWGNQDTMTEGALFSYDPQNFQPINGQLIDSSDNRINAKQPASNQRLLVGKKEFYINGTTAWSDSSSAAHIDGFDESILPPGYYIDCIIGIVSGSNIQNISVGDGGTAGRIVSLTTGLTAGRKVFTVNLPFEDSTGLHLQFKVQPDATATMEIEWIIKGCVSF